MKLTKVFLPMVLALGIVTTPLWVLAETPAETAHNPAMMGGGNMQHGSGMGMMGGGMPGMMNGGMMMGGMSGMMGMMSGAHGSNSYAHLVMTHAAELKLTDEQLGKIARLHLNAKQHHQALAERLMKSMMTLKEDVAKPSADEAAIRAAGKEHNAAMDAMVEHHLKERADVNAILTQEQQTAVKALKTEMPMM